jgi:hypothetical protein
VYMYKIDPEFKNDLDQDVSEFLNYLVENGGPEPQEYEKFISIVNNLKPFELEYFREKINPILNENTLIGHAFVKPFGYPGDFILLDKIYKFNVSDDPLYKKWDHLFQNQPAAYAVRNRKDFFVEYCKSLILKKEKSRVLILGSGPASDVYEFLTNYPGHNKISFELLDFDQSAINYSMLKNRKFEKQISYKRINVLRFNSYKLYDLIWSAGLIDYFKDKHFTFLIRKYINSLTEDGEMVISNFSSINPTKRLMEVISDWRLNYRTESDLFHIASDANVDAEMVSVEKEPLGINLFLKIRNI